MEHLPAGQAGNKIHKYLLYAVGEICLVVIGILIALQINNWNENQKKDQLRKEYTLSMIEDLKQDLTDISEMRRYNAEQFDNLDSLKREIIKQNPDIRALTNMNFIPNLGMLSDINNSTFNALINSGSIDLYEKEIRDELIRHQGLQENYMQSYELNEKVFYETMNKYLQSAPLYDRWLTEEMTEQVWEEVDQIQIAISLNALLLQKSFLLNVFEGRYIDLEKSTIDVLSLLQSEVSK